MSNGVCLYPKLGMFSVGCHLFKPDEYELFHAPMFGKSLFDLMLEAHRVHASGTLLFDNTLRINLYVHGSDAVGAGLICLLLPNTSPTCNRSLRVLQRFVRRLHWATVSTRRLAVAMALHSRLGAESPLGGLGEDLLRLLY